MRFWIGAAAGAAAMYYLDPEHGERRRTVARGQLDRLRPAMAMQMEAAQPTIREFGGKVWSAAERVPGLRVIRGGKGAQATDGSGRPALIANLSETQLAELTRQFDERDLEAWRSLTSSYGWSTAQTDE